MTEMKSDDVESIRKQLDRLVEKLPLRNVPSVRAIRREFSKRLANWPAPDMLNLVESLIAAPSWPRRLIGFELLANHRQAFSRLNDKRIDRLAKGLADWGSIDLFGCSLAGPAWRGLAAKVPNSTHGSAWMVQFPTYRRDQCSTWLESHQRKLVDCSSPTSFLSRP